MSWERYDDSGTRWSWTADDERHLLALHDGELREYHELPGGAPTVHVYHGPVVGTVINADEPLTDSSHIATHTVADNFAPWVRTLDDRELFEYLESGGYAE